MWYTGHMEKKSFFERLTGSSKVEHPRTLAREKSELIHELPSEDDDAQLTVDMWQTPKEIVIQAIVGGVKPDELDVSIARDMVTIRGKRAKSHEASGPDYFYQELFWGAFSRTLLLPEEIDANEAQATIKHGLLTIRLPKLDKTRTQKLRVKNE